MNRNDVIDVLTAVAAADRRTVGEADVNVWQAVIGDLPTDIQLPDGTRINPALQAIRDHLREQPGVWIEPGHIYQRARAFMRDQLEREPAELREARQAALDAKAAEDAVERVQWVGPLKHGRPRVTSLMVACPHCRARPGNHCVALGTNRPPHGGTHPARLEQALEIDTNWGQFMESVLNANGGEDS